MPVSYRRILARALATSPLLLPGCRPPPAQPPSMTPEAARAEASAPVNVAAEREPGADREGPRIREVRFIDPAHLRLVFSESLGSTEAVNPRQFRLSSTYMSVDESGYAYATYADLTYDEGVDASPLVVKALRRYSDDRWLGLVLSREVPAAVCAEILELRREREEEVAYYEAQGGGLPPGPEIRSGLYLHYTERGSAGVQDLAGNGLQPIGSAWALNFGVRYANFTGKDPVARLDLLVHVPCFDVDPDALDGAAQPGSPSPIPIPTP